MQRSLFIALLPVLLFVLSCSILDSTKKAISDNAEKQKADWVNLPNNMKNSEEDFVSNRENSFVLSLTKDQGVLYKGQKITKEELREKIVTAMKDFSPDKRVVYIKGDVDSEFENFIGIFDVIRRADVDRIYLVVSQTEKNVATHALPVKLPALPEPETPEMIKPNPFTLVASLDESGKINLNAEPQTIESLSELLKRVFKEREDNAVFREGTNEIEKTTFIKASPKIKYGEVIKLIDAVKGTGANPIGLQIDDLSAPPPPTLTVPER